MTPIEDKAKAYAAERLAPIRELIELRHSRQPTPIRPLRESEWELIDKEIQLAYVQGERDGSAKVLDQVQDFITKDNPHA